MEFLPESRSPQSMSRISCFKCKKNFSEQNEAFAIADSGEHLCNNCCVDMRKAAHVDDDIFNVGGIEFQPLAGLGSQPHCGECAVEGKRYPMQQRQGVAPAASSGIRQAAPTGMMQQQQQSPQFQQSQQQQQSPQTMARSCCFKCKKGFNEQNEAFAIAESGEYLCNDCCADMRKSSHVDDDIFKVGGLEFEPLAGLGSQPHCSRNACQDTSAAAGGQGKTGIGMQQRQGAAVNPMRQQQTAADGSSMRADQQGMRADQQGINRRM